MWALVVVGSLVLAMPLAASLPEAEGDDVARLIAEQIKALVAQERYSCRGELVCGIALIPDFYAARSYRPAWTTHRELLPAGRDLLRAIHSVDRYALEADDYHLRQLQRMTASLSRSFHGTGPIDARLRADYDLLMTDAFFLLASHILGGRVNPESIHPEWEAYSRETDLTRLLQETLDSTQIINLIDQLHPPHEGFQGMRRALAQYRRIAAQGGWETIPAGPRLERGMQNEAVGRLRRRLIQTGDLNDIQHFNPHLFDGPLEKAVVAFQVRHGIEPDGVVGPQTRRAMNIPVAQRVQQLEINMERWRWIPKDLGRRYLLVNIADYTLIGVEEGRTRLQMRVIVGRTYRKTPVFSEEMTYLVLNPFWNIPHKLALKDVVPKIRKDPEYSRRQGIRVFSDWGPNAVELDIDDVDWHQMASGNLGLRLRQDPGPHNALGRIKFMLPNKYAVYLHDTPARRQFNALSRSFSSGCIRVEDPVGLAAFVLDDASAWDPAAIQAIISAGERRVVRLNRPIPVHILYWTAWSDAAGRIHFRDDIYDRDPQLARALHTRRAADQPT
jgi:murein L,D-transpeptidase YcbB/YkuD